MIEKEKVVEINVDTTRAPVCEGSRTVSNYSGEVTYEPCSRPAAYRKVTRHCGVRVRLQCSEHRLEDMQYETQCMVCEESDLPVDWIKL